MLLSEAALCDMAVELESKKLKESEFHSVFMSKLETLLLDVYASLLPTTFEYEKRKQLVQAFNLAAKSTFGNTGGFPVVEAFGSFIMDIFSSKSDLDLSINFNDSNATCFPRDRAVSILRRLSKVLYKQQRKGLFYGVLPVLHARVPVLKAVDRKTGIECDISVENKDGISRSLFFSIISSIDERFRSMSFLMKAWAKANDINSSKDRTLNSLSIISLVAFHFQTRDPPILPPFSILLRDGSDMKNIRNIVHEFKNFGGRNKESLAQLFVALLVKLLSVEKLWELGLCASTFEGSWISKTWDSKVGNMSVEDFLNRSQNFARSVGKSEMPKIYECIRGSLNHLSRSMRGSIELSELTTNLFGSISFATRSNHFKCEQSMTSKQKQLGKSARPIVKRKQAYAESVLTRVDTIAASNSSTGSTLKRKFPRNKPVEPLFDTINLRSRTNGNLRNNFERKFPCIDSNAENINLKKTRYAEASGSSGFGPMIYPVLPYLQPPPINRASHTHISRYPSGYISHNDSDQPIYGIMGHGSHHHVQPPFTHHLIYASQHHPTAHLARLPYGSREPQHVPPRYFGPNYL